MRFQRVVAEFAAAIAAVVVIAGCASDPPEPLPEPTLSSAASPSPSPSPSITPPTLPPEAEGTSAKAAKAFVRYWIEALNFAGATGDTQALREASSQRCSACRGVIDGIETVHAAGGHYVGDGWSVNTMKYQPLQPRSEPVLTVGVDVAPQTLVESAGAEAQEFDGGKQTMIFRLEHTSEGWVLRALEQAT